MDPIIRVENVGKKYFIRHNIMDQSNTFIDTITQKFGNIFKKKQKGTNTEKKREEFWALKNINFEVQKGEKIGIIGRNGAGKSTLLKILSRITKPTTGKIILRGKVASLLEVGTGFHPELTGRENIFLNGAILGMRRNEIREKFDAIVEFAGIDKFLDTPVKRYSSGMYVRLAFAVAAHLEPDILIIDEVLAVGDTEFQKKCLGKMEDVSRQGRTLLFVSHNLSAVKQLCNKAYLLNEGEIVSSGSVNQVIEDYLTSGKVRGKLRKDSFWGTKLNDHCEFNGIFINGVNQIAVLSPSTDIEIKVTGKLDIEISDLRIKIFIYTRGIGLLTLFDTEGPEPIPIGSFESTFIIPAYFLRPGEYTIAIGAYSEKEQDQNYIYGVDQGMFRIQEDWSPENPADRLGVVNLLPKGHRREIHSSK